MLKPGEALPVPAVDVAHQNLQRGESLSNNVAVESQRPVSAPGRAARRINTTSDSISARPTAAERGGLR